MTRNSVKEKWSNFFSDNYTPHEWLCTKLGIVFLIAPGLVYTLFHRIDAQYPNGLCKLINCNLPLTNPFRWLLATLIIVGFILFMLEIKMVYTTLLLFLLSLLVYSIEESNGLRDRRGILSLLFFAQFLAYLFQRLGTDAAVEKNRIQFAAQFIAGAYLLAAISKLTASGLAWISDSPYVALQILKSFDYAYFDTGLKMHWAKGIQMSSFIITHTGLVKVLFCFSLGAGAFFFFHLVQKKSSLYLFTSIVGYASGYLNNDGHIFPYYQYATCYHPYQSVIPYVPDWLFSL